MFLTISLPFVLQFAGASWIGLFLVSEPSQIIPAGVQCQRNSLALFKCIVSITVFNFTIVTLVNSGEKLHFYLCIAPFYAQVF